MIENEPQPNEESMGEQDINIEDQSQAGSMVDRVGSERSKEIRLAQEKGKDQEELARLRSELGVESGTENGLEAILSSEQIKFFEKEKKIREFSLESDGKIIAPELELDDATKDKIQLWQSKEGVIDVSSLDGVLVVVYNSEEGVPEECRDLRDIESHGGRGRAGEYDPDGDVCSVDISGTYSFLEDKHKAEWVQQIMRHELRHGMVNHEDISYEAKIGAPSKRDSDEKSMDPNEYTELTYLDELHSQYFDVLEGDIMGKDSFRSIDSDFYTIAGSGNHLEVASKTEEGRKTAEEIFYKLQALIIAKRMADKDPHSVLSKKVDELSVAVGTVLATERSLVGASDKIKKIWDKLSTNNEYKEQMSQFLKEYQPEPTGKDNTPELENMPPDLFK